MLLTSGLAACAGIGQPSASDRLATAQAMFAQRCQTAGEKIYRTVDNVDGIYLMKLRPRELNFGGQFDLDDPYGSDVSGDGYFEVFLMGRDTKGSLVQQDAVKNGYGYVEAIDPQDGKRYRFRSSMETVGKKDSTSYNVQVALKRNPNYDLNIYAFVVEKRIASGDAPRYGVTFDDISTREEREHWIAGSSLKVIDLRTNEVMAERIGYMMDEGQGSKAGGRAPWLMAEYHACPAFPRTPGGHPFKGYQTRNFVERVLIPRQPSRLE